MCHNRITNRCNYCNCSRIKRNILISLEFLSWNFFLLVSLLFSSIQQVYGLLRFKFPKLTYKNTEWQLATYFLYQSMRPSCEILFIPASAHCSFFLIRYSILIGCFSTVPWISVRKNIQSCGEHFDNQAGKVFLSSHVDIEEGAILENKFFTFYI